MISEIQNLEEKIAKIDGYSLKELIAEFGEDFLPEGISKYGILKFLLINGYINEGYVDYINYFHPIVLRRMRMITYVAFVCVIKQKTLRLKLKICSR